jgi:general secretion pathway protein J
MRRSLRQCGFTLIELLVAMAIVAIIGAMAFAGLNQVIDQREIARARVERWREIQLAMRLVMQDVAQIQPRPTREEFGETYLPSVYARVDAPFALELSRGGWPNPAGFPRGTVARVAYDWEGDLLVRYHWPVMDRTPATEPVRTELLEGVTNVEVRFMDQGGNWYTEWPPIEASGVDRLALRPRAIEVALELDDYGRVWRLIETSG